MTGATWGNGKINKQEETDKINKKKRVLLGETILPLLLVGGVLLPFVFGVFDLGVFDKSAVGIFPDFDK